MRRLLLLFSLLLLAGCGAQPSAPAAAPAEDPNLGTYWCVSAVMDGMELGAQGQWLRLDENGEATLFLIHEPDTGRWSLAGPSFTMTIGGETIAAGTLENGVLTITLMGMDCVFVREGVTPPKAPAQAAQTQPEKTDDQAAAALPPGMALFTCYGDLYQVTYPTALFYPPGDGLTDLVSDVTGTRAWITRLDSQQAVETWLSSPPEEHQTALPLVVAGYPAQALVYAQEDTWHSQVIVNFGQDLGTRLHPMFAACLTFSGPDREAVWGEAIQQMVHSLTLL